MICITQKQVQQMSIKRIRLVMGLMKKQASSSVSANKIDGHMFDDIKETNIAIKKSMFMAIHLLNSKSSCPKQLAKEHKIHN
jgi:hypothetical protein